MGGKETQIVISGIGGKFPQSDNVLQLQEKLFSKEDFITNEARWTTDTIGVGKMNDVDTFDASTFKMHSKLVRATDPNTTQTLERAFEAIIDSGWNPYAMSGRNIAVISASMISDSENTRAGTSNEYSGFTIMGHNRSMVANRISYTFNFTGPSYSIHTSWAGGMRALEQGAQLIAQGFAEAAVVTTCSLIFYKATAVEYEDMDIRTPGCRCCSFDADANGTCRSEGVVSFFLQKASDAKRNYATVVSARTDCLGLRACSLIHMDKLLTDSLREFYQKSEINPDDIAYLEADGSGIKSFDTLELNALSSVFFGKRKKPLLIGSVKSNLGNTEASSAFLGITKSIIAMETGLIPPNIHYKTPNPDVPALVNGQFKTVTEATALTGDLVSINTLSIGGTMGHVVIQRNAKVKQTLTLGQLPPDGLHRLITVSARHEEGAKLNAKRLQTMPVDVEYASLVNDVFKSSVPGYLWKSFVVVPSNEVTYNIKKYDSEKQPLWFVFSGMGSQWTGMGRDLMAIPVFAAAVDKCDAVLRPRGVDIRHILTTNDTTVFDNILNCFVGIAAVQIGLVDILRTVGLEPDGMVGHSVGELGCAYADGCFTAEEMVLAAYARGKASLDSEVIQGMMAAIGLGYKDMCERVPPSVDIACHNAADSCTLSGPTDDVVSYVKQLKEQNIFAKAVSAGNIAYHSRYIKPIAPKLLQYLTELIKEPKPRSAKWISSSVPEADWSTASAQLSSAEYHTNNLLSPVLFEEACRHLPDNAVVIEIAPHGLLQAILRRSLSSGCVNVALTSRLANNGVKQLLEALGTLYLNNVSMDVNALYPPVEYPVSRGTPYLSPLVTWDHHELWFNEFENILQLMSRSNDMEVQMDESAEDYALWEDHCVDSKIVIPLSQSIVYAWILLFKTHSLDFEKDAVQIDDVIMSQQIVFKPCWQQLGVTILRGTKNFEICFKEKEEDWKAIVSGRVNHISEPLVDLSTEEEEEEQEGKEVSGADLLSLLSQFGYQLGPQFQTVKHVSLKSKGFTAKVAWTGNMVTFLDAVFKLILFVQMEKEQRFLYPSSFRTLIIDSQKFFELEKGAVVEVHYDSRSNILYCQGLQLVGLTWCPDPQVFQQAPPLQWKRKTFVAFNNDKLKLEEFLAVSLQLVAEEGLSSWRNKVTPICAVEVRDNNGTQSLLGGALRDVASSLPYISMKIEELESSQAREKVVFKAGERYLVTGGYSALQHLVGTVESNVFLLAHVHGVEANTNGSSLLRPVLSLQLKGGGRLVLLKKRTEVKKLRALELEHDHWLKDLAHLFNGSDNGQPVVVVSRKWKPQELLPMISKEKFAHRLRCVFLDKTSPQFSLSSPLYHSQLTLGLSVCQLSRGVWGKDCTLALDLHSLNLSDNMQGIITSSDANLDINVVSLNTTTLTYQPDNPPDQVELRYVDYCGTRDSGERVMGVAHFNPLTNTLTPDHSLTWPVPQNWSMEEAATVPVTFSLAYYCLHVKGKLKAGESVLVQVGSCPTSQACIAVALQAGADVFVTVQSKDQRTPLLRAFPQLKPAQVLLMDNFLLTVKVSTGGLGVRLVVNCLPDAGTTLSMSCLGYDSRFIHLSSIDLRDRQIIGLSIFLKSAQIIGVTLSSMLDADVETKTKLQIYVRNGLKKGVVKPFRKRVFTLQNFSHAINNLKTHGWEEKTLVVVKPEGRSELPPTSLCGLHCEPDKTYIIVGSGECLWLDVAEWLVQRGARKLLVAPVKDNLTISFTGRLDRLISLCYVKVMLTSAVRLDSHTDAVDLLREAESLGPVSGVFCVALEEECPKIAHLDSASRQLLPGLKHFVCLLGGSASVCEARAQLGLSACLIQSEAPLLKPQATLPYLSCLLSDNSSKGHSFLVTEQVLTSNQDEIRVIDQDPCGFLPSCVAELLTLAEEVSNRPSLREVVTRSPADEAVKHCLLPVFILPGTHIAPLQPFIRHMMHPAYCASLPARQQSVENTAQALLQEVLRVQEKGPYNVVGESWSGAVALELATLLEAQGHQVELFLLEGAPTTAQQLVTALGDRNIASLDANLLTALLGLATEASNQLTELKTWEDQVRAALQMALSGPDRQTRESVSLALTALQSHLTALQAYKPPKQLFKGGVHLIRSRTATDVDFCGLQKYCLKKPTVHVMDNENHEEMVKSHACATIINQNLLYTWNL